MKWQAKSVSDDRGGMSIAWSTLMINTRLRDWGHEQRRVDHHRAVAVARVRKRVADRMDILAVMRT